MNSVSSTVWLLQSRGRIDVPKAASAVPVCCSCSSSSSTAAGRHPGLISTRTLPRYRLLGEHLSSWPCHAKGLVTQSQKAGRKGKTNPRILPSIKWGRVPSFPVSTWTWRDDEAALQTSFRLVFFPFLCKLLHLEGMAARHVKILMSFLPNDFAWFCLFTPVAAENLVAFIWLCLVIQRP